MIQPRKCAIFEFVFSWITKSAQNSSLGVMIIQLNKSMILRCFLVCYMKVFALRYLSTGMLCICHLSFWIALQLSYSAIFSLFLERRNLLIRELSYYCQNCNFDSESLLVTKRHKGQNFLNHLTWAVGQVKLIKKCEHFAFAFLIVCELGDYS